MGDVLPTASAVLLTLLIYQWQDCRQKGRPFFSWGSPGGRRLATGARPITNRLSLAISSVLGTRRQQAENQIKRVMS